jgi:hypothetical protein
MADCPTIFRFVGRSVHDVRHQLVADIAARNILNRVITPETTPVDFPGLTGDRPTVPALVASCGVSPDREPSQFVPELWVEIHRARIENLKELLVGPAVAWE